MTIRSAADVTTNLAFEEWGMTVRNAAAEPANNVSDKRVTR
jgi:hypothetical protein